MENLNYKMGWLLVFFDLPTTTPEDRKNYTDFRKKLLDDGYQMIQFSVYARSCVTHERVETHARRIRQMIPPDGNVSCLFVTNIQWGNMYVFHGPSVDKITPTMPEQLLFW